MREVFYPTVQVVFVTFRSPHLVRSLSKDPSCDQFYALTSSRPSSTMILHGGGTFIEARRNASLAFKK
jgi:hypothetical protein